MTKGARMTKGVQWMTESHAAFCEVLNLNVQKEICARDSITNQKCEKNLW